MKGYKQTEREFIQQVIDIAKLSGFEFIYHVFEQEHYARRTSAGFPDLIMLKGRRMIVVEVKVKEPLSAEQYFYLLAFRQITKEVYLWTADDWVQIEEVLRR